MDYRPYWCFLDFLQTPDYLLFDDRSAVVVSQIIFLLILYDSLRRQLQSVLRKVQKSPK